jgi:hypothetical protein
MRLRSFALACGATLLNATPLSGLLDGARGAAQAGAMAPVRFTVYSDYL